MSREADYGLQSIDELFKATSSEEGINLPEVRLVQSQSLDTPIPEIITTEAPTPDFDSVFRQHAKVVIKPLSYGIGASRSFPVFDSFSKEEINQWGGPLVKCHIFTLLDQTKESWLRGEILSVKSKSRDQKTNRIGFSLNTFNGVEQKEHWLKITSDGENIFITKNNGYHRTFKLNQTNIEQTQEKIHQILVRDSLKRPFGKHLQPEKPVRRIFLQTVPNN
jgi:hypothetical protein